MLMEGYAKRISRFPKATILVVLAITLAAILSMQYFGIEQNFSEETFMPDMEIAQASSEISEKFTTTNSVSILVKSKNNDVLTKDALVEILEVEKKFIEDDLIKSTLETPALPSASINSVADIIAQMSLLNPELSSLIDPTMDLMDQKIFLIEMMSDSDIKNSIFEIINSSQTPIEVKGVFSMLLTKDFNLDPTKGDINNKAKGMLIIINLNHSMAGGDGSFMSSDDSKISDSEKRMDEIVKATSLEYTEITVMGASIITDEIMKANNESMAILLPLAFGMVIVILAIIYRNIFDMFFSLLALVFAIIWVYGFGAAMGYSFNPLTTAVPILIVGLGIDYGIHFTMRYREEIKSGNKIEQSINLTIISVGMALLLATVTTVVSFLSNLSSPIGVLAEFGVLSAVGIIGSFITMTTFVPACKQILDNRRLKKGKFNSNNSNNNKKSKIKSVGVAVLDKAMSSGAVVAEHHAIAVIIVVSLITIGAVGTATQLKTTFNFEDFLPEGLDISKDLDFMLNEFSISGGTAQEVNILVKGDITDPDILNAISETINNMRDDKKVVQKAGPDVVSILSVMKDWATDTTTLYGIPDSSYNPEFQVLYNNTMTQEGAIRDGVTKEDIKILYEWLYSNPESLKGVQNVLYKTDDGNYESTVMRISVNVDSTDGQAVEELKSELEEDKKQLDTISEKAIITGGPILTKAIMDSLNESQIRSLFITIILSFVILTILFWYKWRSFILGFITLTPVLFCVAWILGTMYLVNISLNVMTITIASLTVGLGITYGIHVTHRFLEDLEKHNSKNNYTIKKKVKCPSCGEIQVCTGKPGEVVKVTCPKCGSLGKVTFEKIDSSSSSYIDDACRSTVSHTGTALFGAAATTIAGFGLLVFALMPPIQEFGGLTALTILFSFIASVLVLPTFLVLWAKWRHKHKKIRIGK